MIVSITSDELALCGGINGEEIANGVGLAGLGVLAVLALPEAVIGVGVYAGCVAVGAAAGAMIGQGAATN